MLPHMEANHTYFDFENYYSTGFMRYINSCLDLYFDNTWLPLNILYFIPSDFSGATVETDGDLPDSGKSLDLLVTPECMLAQFL